MDEWARKWIGIWYLVKGFCTMNLSKLFSHLGIYFFWFPLWQHCSDDDSTTRPLLLVTASVDRIVLKKPISVDADLKIVGSVIWVGRSSIEVQLDMIQSTEGMDYEIWWINDRSFCLENYSPKTPLCLSLSFLRNELQIW